MIIRGKSVGVLGTTDDGSKQRDMDGWIDGENGIRGMSDHLLRIRYSNLNMQTFASYQLPPTPTFCNQDQDLNPPTLHLNLTQPDTESPKFALRPVFNSALQANIIFLLIRNLDSFHMFRLPVKPHQSADEQIVAVFRRFG